MEGIGIEIAKARPEDLDAVRALLADAALPTEGVAEHFLHFLVARKDAQVVGCAGMECYGPSGLLRSLAVAPGYRGRGLGKALTKRLLQRAKEQGVKRVFLLTDTAPEFFAKFGFHRISRKEADTAVQASVEFQTDCCESAVCMRCEL